MHIIIILHNLASSKCIFLNDLQIFLLDQDKNTD